jgi:photosystem II stability/assembly factor-like uncharacterized protein
LKRISMVAPLLLAVLSVPALGQARRFDAWKIVGPGGGGTMIAPTISPLDSSLVVEHCDMTGGYITHDNGDSWRMFNLREGIETFAFDAADKNVIYAGNSALWRSEDRGKSWGMIFPNPHKNTVEHQVGDHSDIFLTSDDSTYPGAGEITAIAIDPGDSRRLYIAFTKTHSTSAIYVSGDRGVSWKQLAPIPQPAVLLTVHQDGVIVVAGKGAYRLSGSGKETVLGQLPATISAASAAHAGNATWIYATTREDKVFLSQDSGTNWHAVTPALAKTHAKFHAIATSDQHANTAYVGFEDLRLGAGIENVFDGIAKTQDAGKTWNIVFKESTKPAQNLDGTWIDQRAAEKGAEPIFFTAPWSLGVAPTDANICYATDLFRTYRTLDGGRNWTEANSRRVDGDKWTTRGLDVTTDYGVQFDPFDSKHIYIDYTDIGLFRSGDGGASWQSSTSGVPEDWRNTTYWIAFDPAVKGLIWGAFSGVHDLPRPKDWRHRNPMSFTGGVGVSTDGGRHWKPSNQGMPSTSVTYIVMDPRSPVENRTLYATAFGRGVYKSIDNGKTWSLRNSGITGAQPFAWRITQANDGTLYLVVARASEGKNPPVPAPGALYRSTDKAEHWVKMNLPMGVDGPTGLTLDPRNRQRLYLTAWGHEGTDKDSGGGVFVSTNAGRTWAPIFQDSQHVYDLTVDPTNTDVLYICGFDEAAYRSVDRGAHSIRIRGYNFKWGHRVILDPDDAAKIYITTYGGGVWHGPAAGDPHAEEDISTPIPVAR